ncbi:hypothetical protein CJJ07_004209 [Candidozyma auris]|nr:hypothetical protein CJJ07_004209 [[Candida] auris]
MASSYLAVGNITRNLHVRVLSSSNDQFSSRDARGKYLKKEAFYLCGNRFGERGDQAKAGEDQLEELGDVGELVEKVSSKNGKRLVDDIYNYTNMKTILGIHNCSRVFACI